jgi:hypothetical protein
MMAELLRKPFIVAVAAVAAVAVPVAAPVAAVTAVTAVTAPVASVAVIPDTPAPLNPTLLTNYFTAAETTPAATATPAPTTTITFKTVKKTIHVLQGTNVLYKIKFVGESDDYIDVLRDMLRTFGNEKFMKCCEAIL